MSVQQQKQEGRRHRRRAPSIAGNGQISATGTDVVRLAAAVEEAPTAEHDERVATAAYFRAQKRGFEPGHELDDWLAAEAEIAADANASTSLQTMESGACHESMRVLQASRDRDQR